MSEPIPPGHSRWTVLQEVEPGKFLVKCSCSDQTQKILEKRYVIGESLSCGCLRRERAARIGRDNLSPLKVGYEKYKGSGRTGKYSPKLPDIETIQQLKAQGLSNKAIGDLYSASGESVAKRLRKSAVNKE